MKNNPNIRNASCKNILTRKKRIVYSKRKKEENNQRKHIFAISVKPLWKFQSLSGIRFRNKIIPAPTEFRSRAVNHKTNGTQRKNTVGYNKVFKIHNILIRTDCVNVRIISPAVSATKVSKTATFTASPIKALSFPM